MSAPKCQRCQRDNEKKKRVVVVNDMEENESSGMTERL